MKLSKPLLAIAAAVAIPGVHFATTSTSEPVLPRHQRFRVSVTNLTRGQIFSPPVVVTHSRALRPLWTLGSAASKELTMLAEDAVNPPLIAELKKSPHVRSVKEIKGRSGVIMPGETASIIIEGNSRSRISLAGMLVTSNDAFYGLNGGSLPRHGTRTWMSPGYDSGTEENNEKCANIPGPPCGNPFKRATANAEGYVHIHAGIHGIGDLVPAKHDWRNGVARISVRRVR